MPYNRCGRSGLKLPAISLGLWHNFGGVDDYANARAMAHRAFDLGITHFDLANNYGPPYGSAEETFGRILKESLGRVPGRADHLVQGRLGHVAGAVRQLGLAQVPARLARPEPAPPRSRVRGHLLSPPPRPRHTARGDDGRARRRRASGQGALRGDLVLLSGADPSGGHRAAGVGDPVPDPPAALQHARRSVEQGLLEVLDEEGIGCIAFSPLAQGLLTDRYLHGVPDDSRAAKPNTYLKRGAVTDDVVARVRSLDTLARERGQSLAQMALAWVLRHRAVTSALVGASRVAQIEDCVAALANLGFADDELAAIDAILNR